MISAEYGLMFLIAAAFLLLVLILTQVVPGRRKRDQFLFEGDDTVASERFLQSIAPPDAQPTNAMKRMDNGFSNLVRRADIKMSSEQALGTMFLTGIAAAAALYFWRGQLLLTAIGFLVGLLIILSYIYLKQLGYPRRLQNQLPDSFFLISRSIRSGMSLDQAIEQAAQQGVQPLASEYRQAHQQIRLGISVPAALQLMGRRLNLIDFDAFVSTIALYAQTGGNLPMLLDRLAASARDHNQFRGYFFAATAQSRVTSLFIGAAAPLLLLSYALFDPEHLQVFFRSSTGWMLLAGCLVLELIGAYWLYRMLKIDYC
ncbi:MAG: type II secretion system F family protein [Planctomycetes bacterium]|nr:type II secretion system F family protein [Planctomycetota bacterium]